MQFEEIVGRKKLITQLREMVEANRLPHSILFIGKEGSGALRIAIAFAQYILCERNKNNTPAIPSLFGDGAESDARTPSPEDSCGKCSSCIKVKGLIHPDLHFSYPVFKKNDRHDRVLSTDYIREWREFISAVPYGNVSDWLNFLRESATAKIENPVNKQGNISSQECEEIIHQMSLKPYESDFKILIMWMPEFLGKEGNRLLKLIEEPPAGTIFIFVAEDDSLILPTLLSRTLLVKIPLPENEEIVEFLSAHEQLDSDSYTHSIASVAGGNLREALRLARTKDESWERTIRDWLNLVIKNNVDLQSKWIDQINLIGREKQKQMILYFIYLIRLSVQSGVIPPENLLVSGESEKDFAFILKKMCGIEVLEQMANELNKAVYYIERNANSKMLFHALTIKMHYLIKEKCLILVQ